MFTHWSKYGDIKLLFQNFVLSLIIPHYNDLQFGDSLSDPHLDQLLRTQILTFACDLGHSPCIEESLRLYREWMANPNNETYVITHQVQHVYEILFLITEAHYKKRQNSWLLKTMVYTVVLIWLLTYMPYQI